MKPDVIDLGLDWYTNKLKSNEPFTVARYGDGEWLTILGHHTLRNSNGCSFTPHLSGSLRRVISEENAYQYCLLNITRRKQGPEIVKYLKRQNLTMDWYNGDLMLDESLQGNLFPLIEQIRNKRVLYVGNERLKDLRMNRAGFFDYVSYIQPPVQNAYNERDNIVDKVMSAIDDHDIDFIGWSSGLAAKVFINDVYKYYPEVTQIDFGSMFDGYFKPLKHIQDMGARRGGVGSRSYIRKGTYDFRELLEANTKR